MSLPNQDASMMNGLSQTSLEDLGLQAALQEVFNLQTKYVIKLHLLLIQHTNADQTTEQRIACKNNYFSISTMYLGIETNVLRWKDSDCNIIIVNILFSSDKRYQLLFHH